MHRNPDPVRVSVHWLAEVTERSELFEHFPVEGRSKIIPSLIGGQAESSDDILGHPLESQNLMVEDMWVCRQMQKGMNSPAYNVGPLAWKYEATMTFYQNNIYDFVPGRPPLKAVAG